MLNISEVRQEVKTQQPTYVNNAPNLHSWVGINLAYRELKRLGWSHVGKHEVERVPVFRLGNQDAYIWRDKSRFYEWTLQVGGNIYGVDGRLEDITADARANIAPKVTVVSYDRAHKEWVAGGERFPAGKAGQRQAQLYALRQDCPDVAAEAEAIVDTATELFMFDRDAITGRAIKAGLMLRDGKVWPGQAPGEVARVNGTADQPYSITTDGDHHYCDCPDFVGERAPVLPNGEAACKHIIAVTIAAALAEGPLPEVDF